MNTYDKIELPPLPRARKMYDIPGYDEEELKDYARAAIEADRKRRGEPVDKGPWKAGVNRSDKRTFIQSDDFTHDVRLYVDGDFADQDEKLAYALGIADQLNAAPQPADPDLVKCAECGAELIPVRPGKWQHPECSQSPWATEPVKTLLDNQEPLGEEFQRVLDKHSWDLYVKTAEPVKVPSSFPAGTEYSVEPHGNGYTIYQGRDQFHHGLNLAHLTECTPEFSKRIESALNAMSESVNKTDWNAELASWSDEDFIRIFHERPDLANRLRKMLSEPVKVDTEALVPSDLANRLRIKAGMITMGEKIAWGSDVELMLQAAQALEIMSLPEKLL